MILLFTITFIAHCSLNLIFVHSYNIVVTTVGVAASQNLIMYRLADMLGQRGHDVTDLKDGILPEVKFPKLQFAKEINYQAADKGQVHI